MVPVQSTGALRLLLTNLSAALVSSSLWTFLSQGLARESELKALKAQVNPHFLFNSLNSISALTTQDPARARQMCVWLAEFLHSTLGLGESITLAEELAFLRGYLEVEQVRFGDLLRLEEHVEEAAKFCLVPPLVLQPLVENAIKHGIAGLLEGGLLRWGARLAGLGLLFVMENDVDPEALPRRRPRPE